MSATSMFIDVVSGGHQGTVIILILGGIVAEEVVAGEVPGYWKCLQSLRAVFESKLLRAFE